MSERCSFTDGGGGGGSSIPRIVNELDARVTVTKETDGGGDTDRSDGESNDSASTVAFLRV